MIRGELLSYQTQSTNVICVHQATTVDLISQPEASCRQDHRLCSKSPLIDQLKAHQYGDLRRQIDFPDWARTNNVRLPFQPKAMAMIGLHFNPFASRKEFDQEDGKENPLIWCTKRMERCISEGKTETKWRISGDMTEWKEAMAARVFRHLIHIGVHPLGGRWKAPDPNLSMIDAYRTAIKSLRDEIRVGEEYIKYDQLPYLKFIELIDAVEENQAIGWYERLGNRNLASDFLNARDVFQCQIALEVFSKFLPYYIEALQGNVMFEITWGLSGGEWALLNILSRIFAAYPQAIYGNILSNDDLEEESAEEKVAPPFPIILLDEPCLHFHPEWQRDLVKNLVELVPQIISGTKSQIIFSTHSPLTVADLPMEHVQILKISAEDEISVLTPTQDFNTFGGDPFTLYRKAFGIQDTYFSGFAREKMEEFFAPIIEGRAFSTEEEDKMRKFARMVGDEAVRYKLLQLIDEKRQVE
ncbi:MAG: AAA family ATPase [Bacteroidetes bacterium]|nr:AAA family ATPase [Bacteroidota bacterium]